MTKDFPIDEQVAHGLLVLLSRAALSLGRAPERGEAPAGEETGPAASRLFSLLGQAAEGKLAESRTAESRTSESQPVPEVPSIPAAGEPAPRAPTRRSWRRSFALPVETTDKGPGNAVTWLESEAGGRTVQGARDAE